MSRLTGKALDWAATTRDMDEQVHSFYAYFSQLFPTRGRDEGRGADAMADYAIKSRTLAAQSGWNDEALISLFHEGLNPSLQAKLTCWDQNTPLLQYISLTIWLDNLIRNWLSSLRHMQELPADDTLLVGLIQVSAKERQQCLSHHLCIYCGQGKGKRRKGFRGKAYSLPG